MTFALRVCGLLTFGALLLRALPLGAQTEPAEISVRGLRPRRDSNELVVSAEQARQQAGTADDPVKVLESMPGLARAGFGSDQILLWGAAPEDTRFYVDGVEIPQLFHGSGLRSTVNGDLLQSVSLSPGAFGADYGRAIGGMVRLETRELTDPDAHASLDASTLDASAMISGTITDQVRVAVAARYGLLDRTLSVVRAPDVGEFFSVPRYQDYQAKLQLALRARETLDAVLLGSSDDLSRIVVSSDPARQRSANTSNSFERVYLRYRRTLPDGSSVELVPWAGRDEANYEAHFGSNPAQLQQQTWRWGLRAEHRARVAEHVVLRLGLDAASAHAQLQRTGSLTIPAREGDISVFGEPPGDDTNSDSWQATVLNVAPYANLDWDLGPLSVTPGLRYDGYLLEASRSTPRIGQTPAIGQSSLQGEIEPRVSMRLHLSARVSWLFSAGFYSQPPAVQDLSAVFGNPQLGPETARHVSLAESVRITRDLSLNVTGFYRALSQLTVRDPSPTPQLARALVGTGTGQSYGMQLLLQQRPWHGLSGSLAYTISRSERRDTPDSGLRLFDYDEPYVLTAQGRQALGAWSFGLRFRYASGAPRTPVVGALYDIRDNVYQPLFGSQNSQRLPGFWQLDARIDRRFSLAERAQLLAYLELLNVTDHENGEEYQYNQDYTRRGVVSGLPIVAVLGARLSL